MEAENNTEVINEIPTVVEFPTQDEPTENDLGGGPVEMVEEPEGITGFDAITNARKEGSKSKPAIVESKEEETDDGKELQSKEKVQGKEDGQKSDSNAQEILDKQNEVKKGRGQARDYSGFEPEEVEMLKNVGNKAFERFSKMLKAEKEAKLKPAPEPKIVKFALDNPEGYLLTKEYKQLSNRANEADLIKSHWQRQEINIRRNGKFIDLDRNAQGQLVTSTEREATVEDEEAVMQHLEGAKEQAADLRGKLKGIESSYKNKYETEVKWVKDSEEKYFPGYGDDKHATATIQKQFIAALPESFQNHPLATLIAKSGAVNVQSINRIKELEMEVATLKGIKKDAAKAPPTKGNFVGSGPAVKNGVGKISSFEDMDKVRKGLM